MHLQLVARMGASVALALGMAAPALAASTAGEALTERLTAFLTLPDEQLVNVRGQASAIIDLVTTDENLIPFVSSLTASNLQSMAAEIVLVRGMVQRMVADGRLNLSAGSARLRLIILDQEASARWHRMSARNQTAIIGTGALLGAIIGAAIGARRGAEENFSRFGAWAPAVKTIERRVNTGVGALVGGAVGGLGAWAYDAGVNHAPQENIVSDALDAPRPR